MASTNPFQHADDDYTDGINDTQGEQQRRRKHGRGVDRSERVVRKRTRGSSRKFRVTEKERNMISGLPDFEGLKPYLLFLSVPAVVVLMITLTGGGWPKPILYSIALGLGLVVAISAFRGVELVMACMLFYLPFSKLYVVPLAPGVNGTNMLILLGLFAAILRAMDKRQKIADWPTGTWLVVAFGVITSLSAITVSLVPGGRTFLIYNELLSYKAWIDQFIFYFIVLTCVRNVEGAKRCVIYMLIGSMLVVLFSVPEMLEKMGRSTIEKSRIEGPHMQSNNFGGFVAYTLLPLVAVFVVYIKDLRAWLLTPYFLLTAKVLITTFSRGAYLAMVAGGLMAGWFKGKGFLAFWATLALCFLLVFPSLIPESIVARMDIGTDEVVSSSASPEDKLDKSSSTRLVMWRAAAKMILEDPVFGKGFKGFPFVKDDYVEVPVEESDPHSMYLYIGSQMGLPALALFVLILGYSFWLGRHLSQHETDKFIRAIGIGGASATACYAVVCIFGSRAVSLNFTAYFWAYLVVMQVIKQKQIEVTEKLVEKKPRTSAFKQPASSRSRAVNDSGLDEDELFSDADQDSAATGNARRRTSSARKGPSRGAAAHHAREQFDNSADPSEVVKSRDRSKRRAKRAARGFFRKLS